MKILPTLIARTPKISTPKTDRIPHDYPNRARARALHHRTPLLLASPHLPCFPLGLSPPPWLPQGLSPPSAPFPVTRGFLGFHLVLSPPSVPFPVSRGFLVFHLVFIIIRTLLSSYTLPVGPTRTMWCALATNPGPRQPTPTRPGGSPPGPLPCSPVGSRHLLYTVWTPESPPWLRLRAAPLGVQAPQSSPPQSCRS